MTKNNLDEVINMNILTSLAVILGSLNLRFHVIFLNVANEAGWPGSP